MITETGIGRTSPRRNSYRSNFAQLVIPMSEPKTSAILFPNGTATSIKPSPSKSTFPTDSPPSELEEY